MTEREAPGKPTLSVHGDVFRLTWPCQIIAEIERISEHRDEITAEVTINSTRPPRPGLLHSARLNLMSTQSRGTLAKALEKRDPDLAWDLVVEALCFLVRERYRAGEPSVDMRDPMAAAPYRWLVEPFVEAEGATILFADGGTGKSLMALAMAVTVSSTSSVLGHRHGEPCPVLYLDWETSASTLRERLTAITAGAGIRDLPPIFYRRMTASLVEAAANVRQEIAKLGAGFVIVDSLGAARAGEPESADMTIKLFNAARSLGVPWLGVDHVTKANGNDSTRPFGSTYTHNLARLTWGVDKAQEEGEDALVVSLTNRKRNNGRPLPRRGYRMEFETSAGDELRSVRFRAADLTTVPGLADKLPLKQRILAELMHSSGPLAVTDLADALDKDVHQVSARLGDLKTRGLVVRLEDGRFAAAARESA